VKAQVYKDPRDPSYFTRFHERVRKGRPDWVYTLVRMLLTPYLLIVHRARAYATLNVPEGGQAIITPNHFSFLDHFFVAVYLRRKVNFMAKSQLFKRPMQFIYTHGGVFPVRRGFADEEAFKTAHAILGRGDIVLMYPEGGRSRSGELGKPKRGLGRLALESGRADGHRRPPEGAQLEAAQLPEGHGPVRRARPLREGREPHARAAAGRCRAGLQPRASPLRGSTRGRPQDGHRARS
jgi:1-acyl-sn-glycerol-3-phosphate acyltransferase